MAAVGLLGAMAPQVPASAASHVSITGTGTNEVVTNFYMTPLLSPSTCFENNFDYASVVSVARMNVNGTNYTVEFADSGIGKQSFGNLAGSYDSQADCDSSNNPGQVKVIAEWPKHGPFGPCFSTPGFIR